MPDQTARHSTADVDQAIAQVRKWASHPDNGWAPDREQCSVLADEVVRLRGQLRMASVLIRDND